MQIEKSLKITKLALIALLLSPLVVFVVNTLFYVFLFNADMPWHCKILTYDDYHSIYIQRLIVQSFGYIIVIPFVISFIFSLLTIVKAKIGKGDNKRVVIDAIAYFIINIIVMFLILSAFAVNVQGGRESMIDVKRISDMNMMDIGLNLYFNDYNEFPRVQGAVANERWENLLEIMEQGEIMDKGQMPNDYCFERKYSTDRQYDYQVSPDGQSYILKAIMTDPKKYQKTLLGDDIDGDIYGLWCGEEGRELEYCVGSKDLRR